MHQENNPFTLKDSKEVYKNPWIHVREDSVVRPDGKDGIFGVVEMLAGVTVVALTSKREILLTKEYAYAVGRYSLECVSGAIDEGESILDAAKRELLEETGAESENWVDLGSLDPFTSVIASPNHMYLAKDAVFSKEQNTDDGEVIDVVKTPFEEALDKVKNSEITHGASVAAILKTHLHLNNL